MKTAFFSISLSVFVLALSGCALIPDTPPPGLPTSPPAPPLSGYEPQSGDEQLKRDQVFLELENSTLVVSQGQPAEVSVTLKGSLSDPCHKLRVVVSPPSDKNEINLEVYSVFDPNVACITVIQPFSADIPLGTYPSGHYTVNINGQLLGEFDA